MNLHFNTVGMYTGLFKETSVFPKQMEIVCKIRIRHGTCRGVPSNVSKPAKKANALGLLCTLKRVPQGFFGKLSVLIAPAYLQ